MKNKFKDLIIHLVLLLISFFCICKFSEAPPIFDFLSSFFLRPNETTWQFELFRTLDNLSMAYIASLIFYLIVDYIPQKREEKKTFDVLKDKISFLYTNMSEIIAYFSCATGVDLLNEIDDKKKQVVDDFVFPSQPMFVVKSYSNSNTESTDSFSGKDIVITIGEVINSTITDIGNILSVRKAPKEFAFLIDDIRKSEMLEKLTKTMKVSGVKINDKVLDIGYLNLCKNLLEFLNLWEQLSIYDSKKVKVTYRKATQSEIDKYVQEMLQIRKEFPEIDSIAAALRDNNIV